MKRLLLSMMILLILPMGMMSCGSNETNEDENPIESTASSQATVEVTKDVRKNGLDDKITITKGSYKECTDGINITPSTIDQDTDDCLITWKTNGDIDCSLSDSKFSVDLTNSTGVHVGTIEWKEANSQYYKLHSCEGANGYVLICKQTEHVGRNSNFSIKIEPEL